MSPLAVRAPELVERMDGPCDERRLFATYRRFALVNAAISGWRGLYVSRIRPLLHARGRPVTLLDVGFGGGDIPRALARWAARDGLALRVTAIDPDERALRFAVARGAVASDADDASARGAGVLFRRATSAELVRAGQRFDVVVSNHVLHHLDDEARAALLADSAALAARRVLHADIERSRLAYALYATGAAPLALGSYVREDGLLSIRRSFTAAELAHLAPQGWRVERPAPFRLLLTHDIQPADALAGAD